MKTAILTAVAIAIACATTLTRAATGADEVEVRQHLVEVALGRADADLVIANVTLLNVHTREWQPAHDLVVADGRIAWVGPTGTWEGTARERFDGSGRWAVPGFGESHKHIESSYLTPEYEAALVIPFGNTWTAEGSHETSNVIGPHNAEFWLAAEKAGSPLKIFLATGSATPPTVYEKGGGYYGYEEIAAFMDADLRVAGLGEVMDWPSIIDPGHPGSARLWDAMRATWDRRGVVQGHGAGLVDPAEITAFAAAWLAADHEVRLAEEGLEKLRRGVFLQVRPDAVRVLFPRLLEAGLADWSNVSVTTDDRDVHATLTLGGMDYNIRNAIGTGVPPAVAYTLGSYNTARHWHLEHLVGSLSPGRYADVVLLTDPEQVTISEVFASGVLAAKDGEYLLDVPQIDYPDWARDTIDLGRTVTAADFEIRAPEGRRRVNVALSEPFYFEPEMLETTLPVIDGVVPPDPGAGISKVAVVDRYSGTGSVSKMFWRGVGPVTPGSALASSQSHDLHNIWVVGNDDAAMALAVNTLAEMGGGWALVSGTEVVAQVRLEIAGLMSQRPVREVAAEVEALHAAADRMTWIGHPGLPDRMRFAFLTCSPWKWQLVAPYDDNPGGFVNVTNGETHPVVW